MIQDDEFDAFYAAWAPRLVRSIYFSTGDMERAKDCVQEAFIRAWTRRDVLNHDPGAWVRTVAWRLAAKDWRRTTALRVALSRADRRQDTAMEVCPAEALALRDALATLPRGQRVVVVLHYFEDLRVREIAEILTIPEGTVKARLSRARTALADLMTEGDSSCRTIPSNGS